MNSKESFAVFLRKNNFLLFFLLGIVFVLTVSFVTLTTKPKISTDEAVSIELSRNFQTEGILDIKTAPGVFSGFGERLQSTGYPVTVPLALFFKLFGFDFAVARVYMLLWMLGVLAFLCWLGRKWFGTRDAIFSFFLIITFASFYANGRTVVGEIPGFLFMLAGLYFLFTREQFLWAGFFLGFAVVSKLSVFGLIVPTLVITGFFDFRRFFKVLAPVAVGMLPSALVWIFLVLKSPFLVSTWASLFSFYQNPYSSSISGNIIKNLLGVFSSPTLLYFGLFFVAIIVARFISENDKKKLYDFVIVYGILAFLYYLRSPGWLRYVFIAELLVLFLLPHAIGLLWRKVQNPVLMKFPRLARAPEFALVALILFQTAQFFTMSHIFSSDTASRAAQSVNQHFPGQSVGVLNAVETALWLKTSERYLVMDLTGLPQIGINPLFSKELPKVLVASIGQRFWSEGEKVINSRYTTFAAIGGYTIYERK